MFIKIKSYNWGYGYHLHCSEGQEEHIQLLFDHCTEIFEKPTQINDSKRNRDLVSVMLKAHGFTEIIFLNELITKNELKKKNKK